MVELVVLGSGVDLSAFTDSFFECLSAICPPDICEATDILKADFGSFSDINANINRKKIEINAGYSYKLRDTNLFDKLLRYRIRFSLYYLPNMDALSPTNGEDLYVTMQLYDGLGVKGTPKQNYEATVQWKVNRWNPNYGDIMLWTGPRVVPIGNLTPDLNEHEIILEIDSGSLRYTKITVDGAEYLQTDPLYAVYHPDWGSDMSAWVTAEVINGYHGNLCESAFYWSARYNDWIWETIEEAIPVTLTLTLPSNVYAGSPVTYSGYLTRTDTGEGLANLEVILEQWDGINWVEVMRTYTDVSGFYQDVFTAPTIAGDYTYRTKFLGAEVIESLAIPLRVIT